MSSSGNESFILCTHPLPSPSPSTSTQSPIVSTVNYTNSTTSKQQDARLCVVASGIGLGVYNLADQTPLSSLTLGPSFKPTSSAVARTTPASSLTSLRVKGLRKTWVGSEQGEAGEIWAWSEEERKDGSIEGIATKIVHVTKSTTVAIAAPRSLPEQLLILSADGTLSLVSESDLSTIISLPSTSTSKPSTQTLKVHHAISTLSFIPSSIRDLIPNPTRAHLVFIVRTFTPRATSASLVEIGKKTFKKTKRPSSATVIEAAEQAEKVEVGAEEIQSEIEVILVDPEVREEGETSAKIISLGKVIINGTQVGVSEDGFVSAISSNGSLESYTLTLTGPIPSPADYFDIFNPTSPETSSTLTLTPLKTFSLSKTTLSKTNTTILPLHSSFLLLVSLRPSPKSSINAEELPTRIVVLIWDVRLGAIISESDISIPAAALPTISHSTTSSPSTILSLSLSYLSRQNISLVVTPTKGTTGRSVIFILPTSFLPPKSVLALVVGKHNLTKKYLEGVETILELAKKREPMIHPKTSGVRLELIERSREARNSCLEELVSILGNPSKTGTSDKGEKVMKKADQVFELFLNGERERLKEYNGKKLENANAKEKERRIAALEEKERVQISSQKYRSAKKKIEAAIQLAGPKAIWSDVTSKRIKNVSDIYRYKYYEVRKSHEAELGAIIVDKKVERALKSAERQEPTLTSIFVTSILRLCFPDPLESESDITANMATNAAKIYRHPTGILNYLLSKSLVGDGLLDGGVTNYLARAGDWPNVHRALSKMPDISETTTISLLKTVVTHHLSISQINEIEIDSTDSLPQPIPALHTFLTSFVESPSTPSTLRRAIKSQLNALEVIPVLEILDGWLGWWAARGGGGGTVEHNEPDWSSEGKSKPKRLPTNPFVIIESSENESSPPRVEEILPIVEAILDAHFVTLLLHRQSHILLRRLSNHIATHLALSNDLSTLIGALSIYSRAKVDQLELANAAKIKANKGVESNADKRMGGATSAARVAAQEKHAEVGEYVVDKFWL